MHASTLYREVAPLATKKPFLSFVVDDKLVTALDDFRFAHRFNSRAAAIIWLLRWALAQSPIPERDQAQP